MEKQVSTAVKHDQGKRSWSLLPVDAMNDVIDVYDIGASKYGRENWRKGMEWHRIFDAMMRHAWDFWSGEERDPVDGQKHLASVAWCALTLLHYANNGLGTDDRVKSDDA